MSKKRKCLNCKKFNLETESIICNFGYFCCNDCRLNYGMKNSKKLLEKETKKRYVKEKNQYQKSDLKTRKAAAKKACHDYIKARDAGNNCICCNKPMTGQIHAGHWLESGNNPLIRYDEDNIHSQAAYCNTYKGGDSGDYERNLRLKIGDKRVDNLLLKRGKSYKRTASDYLEIELHYKGKLKNLK